MQQLRNIAFTVYHTLLLLLIATASLFGQDPGLNFERIPGVDDVFFGKINAMVQDTYGYMWFSDQTNHMVIRYDGSSITKFPYDPESPNSIGGYYPETLARGKDGVIWIGHSQEGGLDRFDPETESFTNYKHDPDNPESLMSNTIPVIHVDREGIVWVGTLNGLDRLDPATGKFTHFRHDEKDPNSLSHKHIRSIYEDRQGTIWIGTGVPWDNPETGGLNRWNKETQNFTRFMHDPEDPSTLAGNKVRALFEDHKGNFWVGTNKNGLHIMDREKGTFRRVKYWPDSNGALQYPPAERRMDHITFITEDKKGYLLAGVYDRGIVRLNPNRENVVLYGSDGLPAGDYEENTSWRAYVSEEGIIWLASQENKLYRADPGIPIISEVNIPEELTCLAEKGTDKIWLGTLNNGLILQDKSSGSTTKFLHSPTDPTSISNNRVNTLYVDSNNTLWIGTEGGLNKLNEGDNNFTRYTDFWSENGGSESPLVTEIFEDKSSRLWIGTNQGLFRFNPDTDKLVPQKLVGNVGGSPIVKILESPEGKLKLVSKNALFMWHSDKQQFEKQIGLQIPFITDAYIDKENVLWVANSTGLWHTDKEWDTITKYQTPQTRAFIGEWTYCLVPDAADNLWMGTVTGIIKLSTDRNEKQFFGPDNGVDTRDSSSDNPMLSEAVMGRDGRIYFLRSPNGYYYLNPSRFENPKDNKRLRARNLRVNNEPVFPDPESILEDPIAQAGMINLKHSENSFGLTFSAIDYRSDLKQKILFRLEGYEDFWRESLSGQPVSFIKVPPGKYNLVYKSPLNDNSGWVEKSIAIKIAPPWWDTGWAYTGYALLLITGIFYTDKYQRQRIQERERNLAKAKELEQAKKIKKAYDELEVAHANLKSTQNQLIHSEKMASLGELTAGIAHEIQNPLNFVNNFSEVSRELIEELLEELKKGDAQEVDAIAKDVIQNLEKILHHGKRADSIVKGMLQHSRSGDGKKEPTDLNALSDEYLRLAYHGLSAKDKSFNAVLETDFDDSIDKVEVVPQEIGRVLLNLFNNAFHAVNEQKEKEGDEYEPTVRVQTRKTEKGVEISVRDNGSGIPEAIRDKIFQPFFTTKPTGEGTGLGLSMSYDIVTKGHGGKLQLLNAPDGETIFRVLLPLTTFT